MLGGSARTSGGRRPSASAFCAAVIPELSKTFTCWSQNCSSASRCYSVSGPCVLSVAPPSSMPFASACGRRVLCSMRSVPGAFSRFACCPTECVWLVRWPPKGGIEDTRGMKGSFLGGGGRRPTRRSEKVQYPQPAAARAQTFGALGGSSWDGRSSWPIRVLSPMQQEVTQYISSYVVTVMPTSRQAPSQG